MRLPGLWGSGFALVPPHLNCRYEAAGIGAACRPERWGGLAAGTGSAWPADSGGDDDDDVWREVDLVGLVDRLEDLIRDVDVGVHVLHVLVIIQQLDQAQHGLYLRGIVERHGVGRLHGGVGLGDL